MEGKKIAIPPKKIPKDAHASYSPCSIDVLKRVYYINTKHGQLIPLEFRNPLVPISESTLVSSFGHILDLKLLIVVIIKKKYFS
jgi:hypothetical protein